MSESDLPSAFFERVSSIIILVGNGDAYCDRMGSRPVMTPVFGHLSGPWVTTAGGDSAVGGSRNFKGKHQDATCSLCSTHYTLHSLSTSSESDLPWQ